MSDTAKTKKTATHWKLTFESGMTAARPALSRIVSAIENLQAEGDGDNWVILDAVKSDGHLAGFLQTACVEPGIHIVEIRLSQGKDETAHGFWKAGRNEPPGAVMSRGKKGLFKTYENEHLHTEEVIAIAEYFYTRQTCHPNFQWRSIREDLEASVQTRKIKAKKRPKIPNP
jgi:hypothetical protein